MEQLTIEYWQAKDRELEEYYEKHKKLYGKKPPAYISDKSYLDPDKDYGEYVKDGEKKIRFYPT